jgi:tellurite resistance protein TehA-like permease
MTETRALIAVFIAMISMVLAASIGLRLLDAKDDVLVTVILFIGCGAAFAVSAVVGHYEPPDERKR